ncbi:ribosomal RNA processing protein 1 homolog A-like [Mercenaria mercenaria]|uniref:ribosomal RNA processing protein 1 homolog A-like n=1 Tax=Mercenaria mercenaria TaxID=6596 RepID=UPI00234F4AC2|nr:ribosomal RNA processing protein 1 homolog A-like [Mercenaria mercenaria]
MESLPVEIKFAQNLAGNETKTRLKAVKKLKKYLKVKSASKKDGFSCEDFLKLWKGLHYCMWMQDKPLLQEELSTTLTNLVHDLSTHEAQMMFIKVFFITEAREWSSIDIWRLDKFMMMVRNMLYESLMVMKKLKWHRNKLEGLTQMFYDTVMNPESDTIPDGLKIHFCDIYLEEVEKAGDSQLTGSQLLQLLDPFIRFMQKAKNATLLKRVVSCVFDPVVTRIADEVWMQQTQNAESDDTEEAEDIPFLTLKFDGKLISDHIFRVSQEDDVLSRNRPMLYGIVKKLQDIQEGVLPQEKEINISEGVTGHEVRQAVNTLMNLDGKKDRKKKNRKKKNKTEKHTGKIHFI